MSNAFNILFGLTMVFTKLSLLWFTRRMVGRASGYRVYVAVLATFAFLLLAGFVSFIFVVTLGCRYVKISLRFKTNY